MAIPPTEAPTGTVTFLFSDIEGSTRLLQRLGERYHAVLEDHHRLLREAFHEGYVAGTEGDAFFVVFRSPVAAVRAAVAAQRMLREHAWPEDVVLKVRMGLHTGEASIAGGDYVGIDVNRTARIAAAAHGGQIIASDATRALVDGSGEAELRFRDLGDHRLKDLARPERLFQLQTPDLPRMFPPPRSLDARPTNLPTTLTPFIGREQLVAEVAALLSGNRLVTLTGPGGTGKTRLAIQVASTLLPSFPDGAFFVPLAPIVDPELVVGTIATALDVMVPSGEAPKDTLREHLQDRELVLVLDNVEQVIAAAPHVAELLAGTAGLRIIATSREALRIDGEQEFSVPPMVLPDPDRIASAEQLRDYESAELFLARAQAVRPGFEPDEADATAVAAICARLDGLPLAIELAAARIRVLTPRQILDRLDRALPVLSGGGRDRPARQQTLRDAIGWSHDLLDEGERTFFRRLAVFRGGCTLEAAEAVGDPGAELGADALELLGSLVDKSLLRRSELEGEPRFLLLYVIREYALERLLETDEAEEIRRRHAEHFLGFARSAAPKLFGSEQSMWLDLFEREHDNLRAALEWATASGGTPVALLLGSTLWRFWQMRGHLHEARERLDAVLALPGVDAYPPEHAAALEAAGGVAYWMADWDAAEDLYQRCLELRRTLDDPLAHAEAAYNRACVAVYRTEGRSREEGEGFLGEALEIFREQDDRLGMAKVQWATGGSLVLDEPAAAIGPFRASLDLYRDVGDRFGEAWALHMLGLALASTGEVDEADERFRDAVDLFLAADDRSGIALVLNDFVVLWILRGDVERALRLQGAADASGARSGVGLGPNSTLLAKLTDRLWTALPRAEADELYAAGRELSVDEALALALKDEG